MCGDVLAVTRLGCGGCGSELSGAFTSCEFCALDATDRDILRVFLGSRGNLKEVERHLAVSYPTARARFDALLTKLGFGSPAAPSPDVDVLRALSRGEIDVEEAERRLGG